MSYDLLFKTDALKEWRKLDPEVKRIFKKKLKSCLDNPHVEKNRLRGMKDCYKIKLRSAGYRLVYQVRDKEVVIVVIAVGKRDKSSIYKIASGRIPI